MVKNAYFFSTEFLMQCFGTTPTTRYWVLRWNFDQSYYLTVKEENVVLEVSINI